MSQKIPDLDNLRKHFSRKRKEHNNKWLLAIDCDRTIVDRQKSSHFLSDEVINSFQKLRHHSSFIVTINTGRDRTSYQPIQNKLSHIDPCIFLSGRVLHFKNQIVTLPEAIIPHSFCCLLWKLLWNGKIPFLDIKHE